MMKIFFSVFCIGAPAWPYSVSYPVTIAASLIWFRAFSLVLKNLKRYSPKEEKMSKESTGSTKSPREVCPPQGIKAGMSVFFNKELK